MSMYCFSAIFLSKLLLVSFFFFFNDTATTEIYTLSLHDVFRSTNLTGGWLGSRADEGRDKLR